MSSIFYIVRHGQSQGNINGDVMGGDPALTVLGRQQAQALAELLSEVSLDHIFSSDLFRAKETAQIIASSKNLVAREDSRLRERSFGELEGRTADYFSTNFKAEIENFRKISMHDQLNWKIVHKMETLNEILSRVLPFFDELAGKSPNQKILMVTHANVMMSLLAHFSYISSFEQLPYGSIKNTAFIKIEKGTETYKIIEVKGITKKA